MRRALFLLSALSLVWVAGCSKTAEEAPKVDPAAAKAQPGADTPPSTTQGAPESQLRSEKSGG